MKKKHKVLWCSSLMVLVLISLLTACGGGGGGGSTGDNTMLAVESTTPTHSAISVSVNSQIIINFNKNINSATVNATTIVITDDAAKTPITGAFAFSGKVVTFTPAAALGFSKKYNVTVTTAVKDLNGNALAANYSWSFTTAAAPGPGLINTSAPQNPVKLIFIHHSVGGMWLSDGNLKSVLNDNNYYVCETDYNWDPSPGVATIQGGAPGDHTDIVDWPGWFNNTVMPYVYDANYSNKSGNTIAEPNGENMIIMFKSCFPNSDVGDSIDDEKQIYNSLLPYFSQHTNKMFVLVVSPPMITISNPSKTRELANWLSDYQNGWLKNYTARNVWVFDFYNVLTDPNNHHRVNAGQIEHAITSSPANTAHPNELYYPTGDDNHPNSEGLTKATQEFVPLLNAYFHMWMEIEAI